MLQMSVPFTRLDVQIIQITHFDQNSGTLSESNALDPRQKEKLFI